MQCAINIFAQYRTFSELRGIIPLYLQHLSKASRLNRSEAFCIPSGEIMVKTIDKAKRIQKVRAADGKRGIAVAVKRFLKRENLPESSLK